MGNNSLKCIYYTKENEIEIKEKNRNNVEGDDKLNTDNFLETNEDNNLHQNLNNNRHKKHLNKIYLNSHDNNRKDNPNNNLNQKFKNYLKYSNDDNFKNQKFKHRLDKIDLSPIRQLDNKDEIFKNKEKNLNNNELINSKQNNKKQQIHKIININDNYNNNIEEKIEDLLKRTYSDSYISSDINETDNEEIKFTWNDLNILSIVPESKLKSNDQNIIIHFGYLNKLLSTGNISSNVEKFCLLSKKVFCIYKSKESLLMKERPVLMLNLSDVEKCDRINIDFMNRKNLENCYFFYILKKNVKNKIKNNNLNRLINKNDYERNFEVYNILCSKKMIIEEILLKNDLIILYSELEENCDKWVCCINYFLNELKNNNQINNIN